MFRDRELMFRNRAWVLPSRLGSEKSMDDGPKQNLKRPYSLWRWAALVPEVLRIASQATSERSGDKSPTKSSSDGYWASFLSADPLSGPSSPLILFSGSCRETAAIPLLLPICSNSGIC
ncbi:hypothetical protein AAC387_Pa04g1070 [Persea americana]